MKWCCIIPAYCEAERIGPVVAAARRQCDAVFVVDDGSPDDTSVCAERAGARVIRHEVNQGKGAALGTGFDVARAENFDAALTLDADGQHDPDDIPAFLDVFQKTGAQVIVGSRMSDLNHMPAIRKWTNWFMSWLLSRQMGQWVPDTQCGFRFFARKAFPDARVGASGFAAESEVLLRLADAGFTIASAPIKTIYGSEKSKIHPVRDTIRFFSMLRRYRKNRSAKG